MGSPRVCQGSLEFADLSLSASTCSIYIGLPNLKKIMYVIVIS